MLYSPHAGRASWGTTIFLIELNKGTKNIMWLFKFNVFTTQKYSRAFSYLILLIAYCLRGPITMFNFILTLYNAILIFQFFYDHLLTTT